MQDFMDTELLHIFVTIVETQSFTRSGDRLFRTQSAISMQIKRLEQVLGKELFDRSKRRIQLTNEGEILLHYARRILALNNEAKSRIVQSNLKGIIRLGTSDDYANIFLPDILSSFATINSGIQIDIVCDNGTTILRKLKDNQIDIAVVAAHKDYYADCRVRRERLVWISAHQGAALSRVPIPLAAFPEGCICRDVMTNALQASKRSWWIAFSSDNIGAIHSAVRSGLAITAVEHSIIPEGVRVLSEADGLPELPEIDMVVLKNQRSTSTAVDALIQEIVDGLSDKRAVMSHMALSSSRASHVEPMRQRQELFQPTR
jgi:DNA-binding transcriptional LysR family regulator